MQQTFVLGPVYTKRQRQRCDDTCDSVLIETMESLQIGVTTHFQATPLFFNENRIVSVIAALTLKRALIDSWFLTLSRGVPHYELKWWHIHQHGLLSKLTHASVQILNPPQFPTIAYGWGTE